MAQPQPRPQLLDALIRGVRFFYLLWGGMLLGTLSLYNRIRLPGFIWQWPRLARFFFTTWGRGLLMGIALAMSVAALIEVWELVDRLLARFMVETEKDHA
jgi:hypothetical protein